MAKELTTIALEKSKPGDKRREIPDGRIGGLYFIVQPNGKRSWAVRYRFKGKPRKFTLGSWPAIDLKTARERAGAAKDKAKTVLIRAPNGRLLDPPPQFLHTISSRSQPSDSLPNMSGAI